MVTWLAFLFGGFSGLGALFCCLVLGVLIFGFGCVLVFRDMVRGFGCCLGCGMIGFGVCRLGLSFGRV